MGLVAELPWVPEGLQGGGPELAGVARSVRGVSGVPLLPSTQAHLALGCLLNSGCSGPRCPADGGRVFVCPVVGIWGSNCQNLGWGLRHPGLWELGPAPPLPEGEEGSRDLG